MNDPSAVAVIIVNYGTAELALEAVASVLSRSHGREVEIHVVDNASPSGDAAILRQQITERGWVDNVRLWCEPVNHGFGRANNLVLAELANRSDPPRYVFLLNPDARLENDAIAILADVLDAHPHVAAAGPTIQLPGGKLQSAAFRFPGLVNTFSEAVHSKPVSILLKRWAKMLSPRLPTGPVDWVSGAAVLMRMDTLAQCGFFDPEYFLYFEETDLMHRMAMRGAIAWHVAEALVFHAESSSTHLRDRLQQRRRLPSYWYQSWRLYFSKNHGRLFALVAALLWVAGASLNSVGSALLRKPTSTPQRFFRDFWAVGIRPLLGLSARSYD